MGQEKRVIRRHQVAYSFMFVHVNWLSGWWLVDGGWWLAGVSGDHPLLYVVDIVVVWFRWVDFRF